MPQAADVLRVAARRTSVTVGKFAYDSQQDRKRLADLIRRFRRVFHVVDETNSTVLRSYRLQNTLLRNRDFRRTPIGVFVGNAADAAYRKGSRTWSTPKRHFLGSRAADSSYLGYFWLPVPKGYNLSEFYARLRNGIPYYQPLAEWTPSPFGPAALQGRPPVLINLHHDIRGFETQIMTKPQPAVFGRILPDTEYRKEFVSAEDLVQRLLDDRYLQAALAAHPKSDIFLKACGVGHREAQVIANAFNRTTHFSTGVTGTLPSGELFDAVRGNSTHPFSVTDDVLRKFDSSLRSAPPELRDVGDEYGWSVLMAFGDADSRVLPIQTVTPKMTGGESHYLYLADDLVN
jgi:hypothetical protein